MRTFTTRRAAGARAGASLALGLWLLAGSVFGARPLPAQEAGIEPLSAFPQSTLAIRTGRGKVLDFRIWSADTARRREQGLMFVRDMDDHAGMLFVFPTDQRVAMWMKNTYLSLDLVFIDARGRIAAIARRATPMSEDIISPAVTAHAVLELKGGIADRLDIREGDLVVHAGLGRP